MKYCCVDCGKEWDYPIATCIFCGGQVNKVETKEYKLEEIVEVSIPTVDHPITPYYVMLLRDSNGSFKFQKTFRRHDIGDTVHITGEQCRRFKIGVIGTGITGRGIAEVALRTGNIVVIKSRSSKALENALSEISRNLYKGMSTEDAQILLRNVITTTNYEYLAQSDFIIESVIEDLSVKRDIFQRLDSICDSNVIMASNTSSLSISKIANGLKYPERVVGLHFFNPISKMKLIEIVKGENTSDDVLDKCVELAKKLNKTSVLVKDTPGFVVNRLLFILINEACRMLEEGVSNIEDIDKAMKLGANHPMGPFELADLIGIDLCGEIIENLYNTSQRSEFRPTKTLKDLAKNGHFGRRSGKGFYEY